MARTFTLLILCGLFCVPLLSQNNNEEDKKEKAVKLTGNLGISLGGYKAFGIDNRRDPFVYQLTTNLGLSVLGVNIPIGAFLGQQELPTLQPFNQIGFSPQYKWIKSHVGYRTMQFSPYTLNSHTFLGAGMEIELPTTKGPKISVAGMYGRFRRPIEFLKAQEEGGVAAYRRTGWGVKLGVGMRKNDKNRIDFMLFTAEDKINSIVAPDDPLALFPHANLVVGVTAQYELMPKLTAKVDYATSAFTRDTRVEATPDLEAPWQIRAFDGLFTPRGSTQYNDAFKTELKYELQSMTIGASYERVEPGYTTLGSYYFQNDLENILANTNFVLKQGKIQLGVSLGRQRDNLDAAKQTENIRLISSVSYNHMVSQKLNINASFSNYSSSLKAVLEEITDSINLFQVSTNVNLGANYMLSTGENPQSVFTNISYQIGNSRDEYEIFDETTNFWNFIVGYRRVIKAKGLNLAAMMNYMSAETVGVKNTRIGPTLSIGKQMLDKKLRAVYALTYTISYLDGDLRDNLISNRVSLSYDFTKKFKATFSGAYFIKDDRLPNGTSFSELRGIASIAYNF